MKPSKPKIAKYVTVLVTGHYGLDITVNGETVDTGSFLTRVSLNDYYQNQKRRILENWGRDRVEGGEHGDS